MKRNNMILVSMVIVLAILACQQLAPTPGENNDSHATQVTSTETSAPSPLPLFRDIYESLASEVKISESPVETKELMRLGSDEPNGEIVYSPNRQLLAIPSTLGIHLFNATTLEEVKFIDFNRTIDLVSFSHDNKLITSYSRANQKIISYDIDKDNALCEGTLSYETNSSFQRRGQEITFTPDGQFVVINAATGIYIFKSGTCDQAGFIQIKESTGWYAISPDGSKLASSAERKTMDIWEIPTGKLLSTSQLNIGGEARIISGMFSSNSQEIATSTSLGFFQIWDATTGKILTDVIETTHSEPYIRGYFDEGTLLLLEADNEFELWDIASKEKKYSSNINLRGTSYSKSKYDISFDYYSDNGKIYGTLLQYGEPVITWDITDGSLISSLKWTSKDSFNTIPDGDISFIAGRFVSGINPIEIWDFNSGKNVLIQTIAPQNTVGRVVLSPDGNKIAISFLGNGIVEIWDVNSGQMEYTLEVNLDGSVGNFEFSPSSQELVASSFPKDIKLWDVNTGQLIKTITPNNGVTTLSHNKSDRFAYSPDGTKLATRNLDDEIEIWDIETGNLKSTLQAGNWTFNLVFSSDGQYLASTESITNQVTSKKPDETKIKIWNVSTRQLVKTLENKLYVRDITFSPDGKQLAVASQSNEVIDPTAIILWDIDSEEVVQTLNGHTMIMARFEYLLEGRVLISSSYDGTIRVWGVPKN